MLLAAISVAGLAFGQAAARGAVGRELGGLPWGEAAEALEAVIVSASDLGSGAIGTAVRVATFLVLATGAIVEIQDSLNLIWKVQPSDTGVRAVVRTRLMSLALVVGIGFLLLVSLLIDAAVAAVGTYLGARFSAAVAVLGLLNIAVSFVIAFLLFAMIFKVPPAVRLAWGDVWTGALVRGLLFMIGKFLIGFHVGRSGVASSYRAAASIITILLWICYSSLILHFGAEFTKAFAETKESRA